MDQDQRTRKSRRSLRALAGVSALALAMVLPGAASATHSWNGYHWARTQNPFTLKLGNNVDPALWLPSLNQTSADWNNSEVLQTTIVAGGTKPRTCRATTGRVEVCSAAYGSNGWLGLASISVSGSHITRGTVKVNDTYFNTAQYAKSEWRNMVMCQEVGHTFGLDHQDTNFNNTNFGTCMDYTSDPLGPPDNEHPNAHDYDELATIYAHLDSTTTVGQTAASRGQVGGSESNGFGRLVSTSRDGKVQTFVRESRSGELEVSFVIWA